MDTHTVTFFISTQNTSLMSKKIIPKKPPFYSYPKELESFNTPQFQRQTFEPSCSWQNDSVICVAQFLLFSLFLCNCVWHFFLEGTMMLNM